MEMNQTSRSDVLIIGAGLSGLFTAHKLQRAGLSVRVLEAMARPGGRILGLPSGADDLHVDLGPTWFWPHQARIRYLLESLDLDWFDQFSAGEALYELQPGHAQRGGSGMAMLSHRVTGGMMCLIDALSGELEPGTVKLSHRVTSCERSDTEWILCCESREAIHCAPSLVLALPPRVFSHTLEQAAWLSPALLRCCQITPTWMAAQAKFVATYDRPFWRGQGLSGDAFSRVGPMVEIHDASSASERGPALFGFVGVPATQRKQLSEQEICDLCVTQLVRMFGIDARQPVQVYFQDWAQNKHIASAADIDEQPTHPQMDLRPFRSELDELNLSFAVSESADEEPGYLEGALQAADRTVQEFLQRSGSG